MAEHAVAFDETFLALAGVCAAAMIAAWRMRTPAVTAPKA
jgi:hypothetical protein